MFKFKKLSHKVPPTLSIFWYFKNSSNDLLNILQVSIWLLLLGQGYAKLRVSLSDQFITDFT